MKEKETFNALLQEAFKPYKAEPAEDLWPLIESEIKIPLARKRVPMWYYTTPIAATILILVGLWFMWKNVDVNTNKIITQSLREKDSLQDEEKQFILPPSLLTEANTVSEPSSLAIVRNNKRKGNIRTYSKKNVIPPPSTISQIMGPSSKSVNIGEPEQEELSNYPEHRLPLVKVSKQVIFSSSLPSQDPLAINTQHLSPNLSKGLNQALPIARLPLNPNESKLDSMILYASRTMSQLVGNEESVVERYDSTPDEEYRSFSLKIGSFTFSKKYHRKIIN